MAVSLGIGLILGIVGCDDGVEHGSVQVGSKGSMAPPQSKEAGADAKKGEPKVMLPGGKKM